MMNRLFWISMLLMSLVGCANKPLKFSVQNTQIKQVWPDSGEMPRYRYIGELDGEVFDQETPQKDWLKWTVGLIQGEPLPKKMTRPYDVFVDEQEKVYVADLGLPGIFVYDFQKKELEVWKNIDGQPLFTAPVAMAEVRGEIWVADADRAEILRFDKQGQLLGRFGEGVLNRPNGLAFDPITQTVYVTDSRDHKIKRFNPKGKMVGEIGERGEAVGEFNFPTAISFKNGLLYVSDSMNARVQILDRDGQPQNAFGYRGLNVGNTPRPKGIAVDSDHNVYVVESYYGYLLVYDQQGRFLLPVSAKNTPISEFYLPAGVTVDQKNRVYVADMFNGRVVMLQYLGAE
ncbi:MAG: hypothetical protein RI556_10820 [Hydrogenovibrio sp.]|uniref:hypothetical protein n=1 Tax=Hydrogenovibrio sp. TaxID=2065821 RepID=UPI0028709D25|nr:hypothetical protein [Hydrogenovibrio sp.]MDR9499657.1 hypothetical protein [Hydrogenovibrio sp.]